jgi:hypothetical protein
MEILYSQNFPKFQAFGFAIEDQMKDYKIWKNLT